MMGDTDDGNAVMMFFTMAACGTDTFLVLPMADVTLMLAAAVSQ